MKHILWTILEFIGAIVLSVIITGILQSYLELDAYKGIILCILFFLCLLAIKIDYRVVTDLKNTEKVVNQQLVLPEILDHIKSISGIQDNIHNYELKIQQVSEGLRFIASKYGSKDFLFVPWYDERINALLSNIKHTIESESYYFVEGQIREVDKMWNVFHGQKTDWFWATSSCRSIEWFSTPPGEYVIRGLDTKFREGKIKSIRRLFIYDKNEELTDPRTSLCLLLHAQSGYEYKVISRRDFDSILMGLGDGTLVSDFGIYGEHFVWETSVENKVFIDSGFVNVGQKRIAQYTELFRRLWTVASHHEINDNELLTRYKDLCMINFRNVSNCDLAERV